MVISTRKHYYSRRLAYLQSTLTELHIPHCQLLFIDGNAAVSTVGFLWFWVLFFSTHFGLLFTSLNVPREHLCTLKYSKIVFKEQQKLWSCKRKLLCGQKFGRFHISRWVRDEWINTWKSHSRSLPYLLFRIVLLTFHSFGCNEWKVKLGLTI